MNNDSIQVHPGLNQGEYLTHLTDNKTKVNVYLVNGIKLEGVIVAHDQFSVFLLSSRSGQPQMVYKHAISTVQPH